MSRCEDMMIGGFDTQGEYNFRASKTMECPFHLFFRLFKDFHGNNFASLGKFLTALYRVIL